MNNAQGWSATPWTNTSETDPMNITTNLYSVPWTPNPSSLINGTWGNGYFWNFTHNVDFYQSYRVKMVHASSFSTVNSNYYVSIGGGGLWEIDFY